MAANKYCLLILILLLLLLSHSLPTSYSRSLAISRRGPMEIEQHQQQQKQVMAESSTIIGHLLDHWKLGVGVHGTARRLVLGVRGRGKSGRKRGKKRTRQRRNSGAARKVSPWHVTSFVFCFVFLGRFML